MKRSFILVLLICSIETLEAQNKCDSLSGKWIFTSWQTNIMFIDTEDPAASIQFKIQQYKEANNGASIPTADSVEMVNAVHTALNEIKTNGFISFNLNKDKTFDWKGTVNDPEEQFSGTYSCNGDTITFLSKKEKTDTKTDTHPIVLQILSFKKNRLTLLFPSYNNPNLTTNRMSFKRVL